MHSERRNELPAVASYTGMASYAAVRRYLRLNKYMKLYDHISAVIVILK